MTKIDQDGFARALDAVVTSEEVRRNLDGAPVETLSELGVQTTPAEVEAALAATPGPALFAPPYVPVGPAITR
jgi:hypothetical protein